LYYWGKTSNDVLKIIFKSLSWHKLTMWFTLKGLVDKSLTKKYVVMLYVGTPAILYECTVITGKVLHKDGLLTTIIWKCVVNFAVKGFTIQWSFVNLNNGIHCERLWWGLFVYPLRVQPNALKLCTLTEPWVYAYKVLQ